MPVQISFSSLPLPGLSEALADTEQWHGAVSDVEARHGADSDVAIRSRALVESPALGHLIDAVVHGRRQPLPPRRMEINKAGPRKKVVYQLQLEDELLSRVLNRVLQPWAELWLSPHCHSFRAGHSAVTAFASLLRTDGIDRVGALHLDVADFFNSIDVDELLQTLPEAIKADAAVMRYLTSLLTGSHVVVDGTVVVDCRKGVMAGTPLAPLLSNLYLRELDAELEASGLVFARYSDDILVLGAPDVLDGVELLIRGFLEERGLQVNERKTRRTAPGEPWDFLGLRYASGQIGLSANTMRKVRAKVRRRARRLSRHRLRTGCDPRITTRLFVSSLNRTLYGFRARGDVDFSWGRWFFPLLTTSDQLAALDAYVQQELRWAMTGTRRPRAREMAPYEQLAADGYIPLRTAYSAFRASGERFLSLLEARANPRLNTA